MKKYIVSFIILGWMSSHVLGNPCAGLNSSFVAHADCTRYYSCVNGVAHEMQCPAVFPIFRPDTQMCDSGNPNECVVCPPQGLARFPVENSCTQFILCVNGVQSRHECLNGLVFDRTISECNLAANAPPCVDVTCPANDDPANPTFIRHPSNCRQYFICVSGKPVQQECPPMTAFNPNTNVCDLESNVQCPATLRNKATFLSLVSNIPSKANNRCIGNKGILNVPDPDNCSRYFMCMNDNSYSLECSKGMIFDTKTKKCGVPEISVCIKDVENTTNPCAGNTGMKYKPHPNSCDMYYMCMGDKMYELTCPAGKLYDSAKGKCESSSSVICEAEPSSNPPINPCAGNIGAKRVADQSDCASFFICANEQAFKQTCASPLIFDVLTNDCNRPEVSVCTKDIATPPVAGQTTTTSLAPSSTPSTTDSSIGDDQTTADDTSIPTAPTTAPTAAPTVGPTSAPTVKPTSIPEAPTPAPTTAPIPTAPTPAPTQPPTQAPTQAPTPNPTTPPTPAPTLAPPNPSEPYCTPGLVFYHPHPDCSKFYRCVYGSLFVIDCPRNQFWNQAREYCDHIWNVNCPSQ